VFQREFQPEGVGGIKGWLVERTRPRSNAPKGDHAIGMGGRRVLQSQALLQEGVVHVKTLFGCVHGRQSRVLAKRVQGLPKGKNNPTSEKKIMRVAYSHTKGFGGGGQYATG